MMGTKTGRLNRTTGGFTLIEVMITIGILTFGLVALAAMQIQALHGSDRGRHATHAAAIAENKMEQNAVKLDGVTINEITYNVSHHLTDIQATFTRAIDVQVSWTEESGETRSVTLSSIRYNREGT
jgi:prepilin-type N-terminal cleavage/methylation domain-containing protein